jgi:integrase
VRNQQSALIVLPLRGEQLWLLSAYRLLFRRSHPQARPSAPVRHSFATEALRRGMNVVQLARILDHTSLRMIERTYSHLNVGDAYDAIMKMLQDDRDRR